MALPGCSGEFASSGLQVASPQGSCGLGVCVFGERGVARVFPWSALQVALLAPRTPLFFLSFFLFLPGLGGVKSQRDFERNRGGQA